MDRVSIQIAVQNDHPTARAQQVGLLRYPSLETLSIMSLVPPVGAESTGNWGESIGRSREHAASCAYWGYRSRPAADANDPLMILEFWLPDQAPGFCTAWWWAVWRASWAAPGLHRVFWFQRFPKESKTCLAGGVQHVQHHQQKEWWNMVKPTSKVTFICFSLMWNYGQSRCWVSDGSPACTTVPTSFLGSGWQVSPDDDSEKAQHWVGLSKMWSSWPCGNVLKKVVPSGTPIAGWFINVYSGKSEHLTKVDDLGVPLCLENSVWWMFGGKPYLDPLASGSVG